LNVIDTAPNYEAGYSEQIVGRAVQGVRDQMFVIDKIDNLADPVAPQIDASLKNLNLDHVDLFVFHSVQTMDQWNALASPVGGMHQLNDCIQAGKARFRGISCHHPEVLRAAILSGLCDIVMFAVGPYVHPRYVLEALPLARSKGVGTITFKTFGAGKLISDTTGYNQPLADRPRGKTSSGGTASELKSAHLTVRECIHYTLTCAPDCALLGLSFPNEQDAAFAAAADFQPLSEPAMADIRTRAAVAIQNKGKCWWNPDPDRL
jgi:aryl-alcohol dehydrogenase-like predicted oxidoreductase